MAVLAGLIGIVGRFAGKVLTTLLGWASTLLFGKVPPDKQLVVVLITFGSIAWLALVAGVIVPDAGTFLLGFVPVPGWLPDWVVRLAMLIGAIVLPLVIGGATLLLGSAGDRGTPREVIGTVLRGYPLAALLALSLGLLALIAAGRKMRSLAKRWSDAHVPVIVKPGRYEEVLRDLEAALDDAGLDLTRRDAPRVVALPGRILGRVAGRGIMRLVPERLVQLTGEQLEVGVYPSDLSLSGSKDRVARARAALASRLTATDVYLTTTAEAQGVEDRLTALAGRPPVTTGELPADVARELADLDAVLARLDVAYDEWEVLYRMRLQVERDLRAGKPVGEAFPAPRPVTGASSVEDDPRRRPEAQLPAALTGAVGVAGLVLLLLDVVLLLGDRLAGRRSDRT
jgi:hypothetical protein